MDCVTVEPSPLLPLCSLPSPHASSRNYCITYIWDTGASSVALPKSRIKPGTFLTYIVGIAQMSFSPTFLVHWFLKELLILCIWYGFYYFRYDKHYWLVLNRLFSSSHPNIYLHFVALGKENEFEEVGVRAHRSWYESEVQSSCPAAWFFPGRWIWFSSTHYLWGTFKPLM